MPNQPDLSIIIVNWKSAAYLRKCLRSIYANTKGLDFEVVVADNASFDGCDEMVKAEFPTVRFVQSETNLGFAGANNLGFRHSSGKDLLFLNPDTEIIESAIEVMWSFLEATPDAGAVGCKLLNTDLSIQTSCIQAFPTLLNEFLDSEHLRRLFPRSRLWGTGPLFDSDGQPAPVEVISGACLMVRRKVFEQVGWFSTEYFMYAEDMDLCYRVQKAGWKNCYLGEPKVIHHGGGSSNSSPKICFAAIMMRDSKWKFMRETRGRFYASAYRAATAAAALGRLILLGVVLLLTAGRFRRARLSLSWTKWVKLLRWAVGLETWVKGLEHEKSSGPDFISVPRPQKGEAK